MKEWGERNYGEACSNLNMGLPHFEQFLAQTWQFIG